MRERHRLCRYCLCLFLSLACAALLGATDARLVQCFPAAGARDVPPDTPLRLMFEGEVALGSAGHIGITDTATGAVVETIDVAAGPAVQAIGGIEGFSYHPVRVSGSEVVIHLRHGALQRGRSYTVSIAPGAIVVGGAGFDGFSAEAPWRFSTRSDGPAAGTSRLTVATDGTGDFCTVQGALDFIPRGNTAPVTVVVRPGTYTEILCLYDRHGVTLRGEDRKATVIAYPNNANFNGSGGNPFAPDAGHPSAADPAAGQAVYRRAAVLVHQCRDFMVTNLTLHNTTPQGGSQAEALIVNSPLDGRTIIRDVDFFSYQDTVQINGQAYVANCHVEGDVDFLWGTGPVFFEDCTFRSLRTGAYYTQVRNPPENHGFVFVDCRFEGAPGVRDNFLTRVEPHRFPHSEVVLIDCVLTEAVGAVGWQLQRARGAAGEPDPAHVHFWEFNSRTPEGHPVAMDRRMPGSRRLDAVADRALIGQYRDPAYVLGGDWDPVKDAAERVRR